VTEAHTFRVARETATEERHYIVYRGAESSPREAQAKSAVTKPSVGQHLKPVRASETLLFRYSALTATTAGIASTSRDPGLIVQGPLQATLLLQFAVDLRGGQRPAVFEFRASLRFSMAESSPSRESVRGQALDGRCAGSSCDERGGRVVGVRLDQGACVAPVFVPGSRPERSEKASASGRRCGHHRY
jgi:hypothetical protein